jgi:ligand-binding SRPBCC domain-containing protein
MRHSFTASQWIAHPIETVFAFFANPRNLLLLTPPWNEPRIEGALFVPANPPSTMDASSETEMAAGAGSLITISFRPFRLSPVRLQWEAKITEFVWNEYFCDEQVRGPFAYWKHCHRVQTESRDGVAGTRITDEVVYEMKMGALGNVAHRLFFAAQIRKLFAYRQAQIEKLLRAELAPPRS